MNQTGPKHSDLRKEATLEITRRSFKYLIVGFGPAGLSTLDQLLLSGVSASDIAMVGPRQSVDIKSNMYSEKDANLGHSNPRKTGIRKLGIDTSLLDGPGESLANYWGASQLPPISLGQEYLDFFPAEDIKAAIFSTAQMLGIQAEEQTKLAKYFPICGEEVGKTHRKEIARRWVSGSKNFFVHSRLSIGGHRDALQRCENSSLCFHGCPTGAFWTPRLEFGYITKKNPGLTVLFATALKISLKEKTLSTLDSQEYSYEHLFLCAGPKNTIKILDASKITTEVIGFHYTPVVMQPFLVRPMCRSDYEKTHVLADLLLPMVVQEKLTSLVQMYFPTDNLTSNILSKIPRMGLFLLGLIPSFLKSMVFRRIGIAMFFLKSVQYGTKPKAVLRMQKDAKKNLQTHLKFVDAKLIKRIKVLAIDGASHHTGSIFLGSDTSKCGLNSDIFKDLEQNGIYLADGLALVEIPPGPHTNTVCVISRCLVLKVLKK